MFDLSAFKNLIKPTEDSDKFLTIDIGSDAIKCLAFYHDGEKAKVIGYGKRPIEMGHVRSGTIVDIDGVEESLREAVNEATQNSEETINQVIFGLSGNYSVNQMTTARLTRTSSGMVTQKEIDDIYQRILDSAYEQALTEISQTSGMTDLEIQLVTSSTAFTKIDDKHTHAPLELSGTRIELGVYTSYAPMYHIKNLEKLAKKLGLEVIAIAPEMFALTKALNISAGHNIDAVLINVGSDKTEITVVFGGNIVASKTLPIGGSQFTYQISTDMGLSMKEAEALKRTYSTGKLTQNESVLIQESLTGVLETWISGIELTFSEFRGIKTFASKVFLTGGGISLPDAYESLTKKVWYRGIPFKPQPQPEFYKVALVDLPRITDSTQMVSGTEWVMPSSLAFIYFESRGALND